MPFPSPGDSPNPGIEPASPALQADSLLSEPPGEPNIFIYTHMYIYIYSYICACVCSVASIMSDSLRPHQAPLSMGFSRQEYWSELPCCSPRDLPNPGIKPRSPALQADSLPSEPLGKPKNTGVGSLSLLQQIFPTQELNRGLLHCRWILYQLSYHPKLKLATAGGPPWGQPPATALFS